jgi:putative protease
VRIVIGAKAPDEAEWLLTHGASEVYCGLPGLPNHRDPDQCLKSDAEFVRIARFARRTGKRALLALNEACFEKDYPEVARRTRALVKAGAGGVVVKELPLLRHLVESGVRAPYILSSLALTFNSRALEFYKGLGVTRVILPFHLLPQEAGRIIRNPWGIETEVFFHADFCCPNMDPVCRLDGWAKSFQVCRFPYMSGGKPHRMPEANVPQKLDVVYDFYKAGVGYLKLIRTNSFTDQQEVLKEALCLRTLLRRGVDRAEFKRLGEKLYFRVSRHCRGR